MGTQPTYGLAAKGGLYSVRPYQGYSPGKQPSHRPSVTFAILVLATYGGSAEYPVGGQAGRGY